MASTTYSYLAWEDHHRIYLNQLYTLYHSGIDWHHQLCDIGYDGYPDPVYRNDESEFTPDFLAVGADGDIQHIDVKGFEYIERHFDGNQDKVEKKIKSAISELTKYRKITDGMVTEYLENKDGEIDISCHEIVALVPYEVYNEHKSTVEEAVRDNDLVLWLIKTNGESKIWKTVGSHSNQELNSEISKKLIAYPGGRDLIQFTRQTRTAIKKFKFIEKLVKHCSRERVRTFRFEEIDRIMTENRPPLLGHLQKEEREEIWQDYIYSLLHHLDFIEHGEGENEYIWKKKRFMKEPRDRKQILNKAKDELNLD